MFLVFYIFLVSFFVFLFGLCVGSFLNVLIIRLPKEESVSGRSYCPRCKKKLAWHEMIPIFSFLFLGGKCGACKKKISWQYPLVEITTGILFLLVFNFQFSTSKEFSIFNFQSLLIFCCSLIVVSCLIVVFVVDLKHMIIPNEIILVAVASAFLYQIMISLQSAAGDSQFFNFGSLGIAFLSGILSFFFFLFFAVASKGKWMGMGDVKLVFFMGVLLSFPNILVALLIASVTGSIIGVALVISKNKKIKSKIPFGPFLSLGTILAFFWSEKLIDWYVGAVLGF